MRLLQKQMSKCRHCGEEIHFRHIDGKCVPIHPSGFCEKRIFSESDRKSARQTSCPMCKKEVWFVEHNGGKVYFDELGDPWPKHGCMDTQTGQTHFSEKGSNPELIAALSKRYRVFDVRNVFVCATDDLTAAIDAAQKNIGVVSVRQPDGRYYDAKPSRKRARYKGSSEASSIANSMRRKLATMPLKVVGHISDADLMLYCLGVIRNENELKPLEEHLLGCQHCVDRAEEIDRQASKSKGDGGRRDVQ